MLSKCDNLMLYQQDAQSSEHREEKSSEAHSSGKSTSRHEVDNSSTGVKDLTGLGKDEVFILSVLLLLLLYSYFALYCCCSHVSLPLTCPMLTMLKWVENDVPFFNVVSRSKNTFPVGKGWYPWILSTHLSLNSSLMFWPVGIRA